MNKVFFFGGCWGKGVGFFFLNLFPPHNCIYFFGVDIIYTFYFHLLLKRSTDFIVLYLFIHFFK